MKKSSCSQSAFGKCNDIDENDYEENLDAHDAELETVSENTKSVVNMKRKKGMNWSEKETNYFIQLCIEKRILKLMEGKKYKHIDVYKSLEPDMKEAGFIKSGAQMKMKMKHLKEMHYKCKRNNLISGHDRMSFQYFEAMDELLGGRPSAEAVDGVGIESSASKSQELEIKQGTDDDAEFITKNVLVELQVDLPLVVSDKKRRKTGGRLSNAKRAEQFSEMFVKQQAEMFHGMFKTQNELLEKSSQAQIEEQRKWEAEMMKKEHDHQMQQMSIRMDGFLKGLQTMQLYQYLPSFHPTVQFPGSSAYSSQTPPPTFMRNPSPSSISALSCSSNSMSSQMSKTFVPPASSSPSTSSDCIASWAPSSSSLEIPLCPSPNHQLSSSVPQDMYFVPIRSPYPTQTSPATDKQTE